MSLARLVARARGDEPADLVLRNARLVNVLSGEIHPADVAVAEGLVVGVGDGYRGREVLDLGGRFLCPGFLDAHVHVESSHLTPREYARAVVPRGVTTVVADPHEVANVAGIEGVRWLLDDAAAAPFTLFAMAPSCVPASPLATSGARLDLPELAELRRDPRVLGLGEVMAFPDVVAGRPEVLAKVAAFEGSPVDGHCPGLGGRALQAYAAAGITSDHECTGPEEAREKLRAGLAVFAREASGARDLLALLPLVTPATERRFCLATDDREPGDLLDEGSVDHLVRLALAAGLDPVTAVRLATLNPAEHFGLRDRGAVAPGRRADLAVFSDWRELRAELVFVGGRLVARGGALAAPLPGGPSAGLRGTVRVEAERLRFEVRAGAGRARVVGVVPDQLATIAETADLPSRGGFVLADPARDLCKLAVVERHGRTGGAGLGFVRGLGLRRGALASTVAHDHHNLVVAGVDDASMRTAARAVCDAGGGQAAACGEAVLALLPLPLAGLLSDRPLAEVRLGADALREAARELGSPLRSPFATLSFLGLEVIPALKLTDRGLVDVAAGALVSLFG